MSIRRVKMLNMALCVLQEEISKLFHWSALEMVPDPNPETVQMLEGLDAEKLLRDFDEALVILAEARNSFAEEADLGVPELTVELSRDTFSERS